MRWEPRRSFGEKGSLTKHIDVVHLKLREHACPYCPGVAFGKKQNLLTHIDVVHLKLRDHACPYCPGVAFPRSTYHADEKPPDEAH